MACINMYNHEAAPHQGGAGGSGLMSPRISFSNDFVLDQSSPCGSIRLESRPSSRPSDSSAADFEFSAGQQGQLRPAPMIAADEAFCKGRLVPLRESPALLQRVTLRDELVAGDVNSEEGGSSRASAARTSSSLRWKERLGLRKAVSTTPTPTPPTSTARRLVDKMLAGCGEGQESGLGYYNSPAAHVASEQQEGKRTTDGAAPASTQRNLEIGA